MGRNLIPAVCRQCGAAFMTRPDQPHKHCSSACYHQAQVKPRMIRPCEVCGEPTKAQTKASYATRFCSNKCWLVRRSELRSCQPRACLQCGAIYEPHNMQQRYCSTACHGTAKARDVAERLWEKVDKSGDCWVWTGTRTPQGYGYIGKGRTAIGMYSTGSVHRVSWELANGPIPDGLWVLHHCDNPPCVRPEHLWLGTVADNNHDRDAKGRQGEGYGPKKKRSLTQK